MEKAKIKLDKIKEGSDLWLDDYLAHLKILLAAQDQIHQRGLILPAALHIQEGIKETMVAINETVIRLSGLDKKVKKLFNNASANHYWDLQKTFCEWRKEKGGILNLNRTEI